jgi:hypothetical protein
MDIPKELIDKHREINVHDNWYDHVYEEFKDDMGNIGIHVDEIYFSGFWSQGDGACFDGCVDDWTKFLPTIGYKHPVLVEFAKSRWEWRTYHRGLYYHSGSVYHDDETEDPVMYSDDELFIEYHTPYIECELRSLAWLAVLKTFDYDQIRKDIKEELISHMDDLYSRLENEYEYLTSDEQVAETIIANDLHKEIA